MPRVSPGWILLWRGAAGFLLLGGLDCLVFTGGIGEHAALVRELACSGLEGLGIELDAALNATHTPVISQNASACQVRVVATNEDLIIARSAHRLARGLATKG